MDKKGKITLGVLIISIILVSFFSLYSVLALGEDIKEYDSVNKIVTIKDSSGKVISDITLNTPLDYLVPRGYQKVAEFTIDNKIGSQQSSLVLEKLDFYDVNNRMQKFNRPFDYKYEKNLGLRTINDYETVCVDEESKNGTIFPDCSQVLTGTHQEEMFEWVGLNSLGEIPSGKIKIGIFTEVKKGDKVEWVPTFLGIEVDEWAEWTESLNVGLVSYYKLDETSGSIAVDSLDNNNLTNFNSVAIDQTGKIGPAYDFSGATNRYLEKTIPTGFINTDVSSSMWLNFVDADQWDTVWMLDDDEPVNRELYLHFNSTTELRMVTCDATGGCINSATSFSSFFGSYVHIATVSTATYNELWINGNLKNNQTGQWDRLPGLDNLTIGNYAYNARTRSPNGLIDEIGLWNRTLTASEISDLYNSGSGIPFSFPQNYTITFNLTDSGTGEQLDLDHPNDYYALSCDNGFNYSKVDDNPNVSINFGNGIIECTFSGLTTDSDSTDYFDETVNITADENKTVEIPMSRKDFLTQEEHDWLEAVYDCIIDGMGCA
jgi:hypothetical protein